MRNKEYNKIAKDGTIEQYENVRAKGYNEVDFDAKLVDAQAIPKAVGEYAIAKTKGSDNIEIIVENMYPGYAQAFRTDILNVGSIAAKLSNMKFDINSTTAEAELNDATKGMLGIALFINKEAYDYDKTDNNDNVFRLCKEFAEGDNYFTVGGVDFLRLSAFDQLEEADIKAIIENSNLLCSPDSDNRMDLFLAVAMDPDAEGTYTTGTSENMNSENIDANSQNQGAIISIDFLWDQFNLGVDAGNPNYLKNQNASKPQ